MKTIKKRLTVINDGFSKTNVPAAERINAVVNRYVKKMGEKGYIPTYICGGNAFNRYENIVTLSKPKNVAEKAALTEKSTDCGWQTECDIYFWA